MMLMNMDGDMSVDDVPAPKPLAVDQDTSTRPASAVGRFQCKHCGKPFAKTARLIEHERVHTGERPFTCELCGKSFQRQTHLNRHHRSVHLKLKPFKCDFPSCNKAFPSASKLKRHSLVHEETCPFKCETCGEAFSKRYQLHAHITEVHEVHLFECPHSQCGASFKSFSVLKRHVQSSHSGDGHFSSDEDETSLEECVELSVATRAQRGATRASPTYREGSASTGHHSQGPSAAARHDDDGDVDDLFTSTHDVADEDFDIEAEMEHLHRQRRKREKRQRHTSTDSIAEEVERAHVCDVCQLVFATRSAYVQHCRQDHISQTCGICGKTLHTRKAFDEHSNWHETTRELFFCMHEGCDKVYLSNFALQAHIKAVHEHKRVYICTKCNKAFSYWSTLQYHQEKAHGLLDKKERDRYAIRLRGPAHPQAAASSSSTTSGWHVSGKSNANSGQGHHNPQHHLEMESHSAHDQPMQAHTVPEADALLLEQDATIEGSNKDDSRDINHHQAADDEVPASTPLHAVDAPMLLDLLGDSIL